MDTLFLKLKDGCQENQDYINLYSSRRQSEQNFGESLSNLPQKFSLDTPVFDSSTQISFIGINGQLLKEAEYHLEISKNIENHVIMPFTNWAIKHKQRVEFSETQLKTKVKAHDKLLAAVKKSNFRYMNKARSAEDLKQKLNRKITETIQRANTDPEDVVDPKAVSNLKRSNTTIAEDMKNLVVDKQQEALLDEADEQEEEIQSIYLGGDEYTAEQVKGILVTLLNAVPKFSHKVAIFGTYERVSTGSSIVEAIQKNLGIAKLDKIELFGQDLITNGYLRLIGTVGNQFANSSKLYYQWKPEAYKLADIPLEGGEAPSAALTFYTGVNELSQSVKISEVLEDVRGMITTVEPNEENYQKILKDVKKCELEYYENTKQLDVVRTELEEVIEDHLNFMQRCELDRLRALKKVQLDFLSILANKFSSLKSVVDKSMAFHDTMNPESDLLNLIETYKTGPFIPHPRVFDDYFNSLDSVVFGSDLQKRSTHDGRSVPKLLSSILIHLDSVYPSMKDDDERINTWLKALSPLAKVHEVRSALNDPKFDITDEVLSKFSPAALAETLKLYLLELPNSLVPNEKYNSLKILYSDYGDEEKLKERITGLESLLEDLPRPNMATLSYLCDHLRNIISIVAEKQEKIDGVTKADYFKIKVSQKLGFAVLRPKISVELPATDTHPASLLLDLITYKEEIFKELKKRNTVKKANVSRKSTKNRNVSSSTPQKEPLKVTDSKASEAPSTDGESLARKSSRDEEPDTVLQF